MRSVRSALRADEAVMSPVPSMRPGTVLGCCVSLLVAGVLLARGFVGVLPSRPVYLALGGLLAATALASLVVDHVMVRVRGEAPDHVLVTELDRSRRYGHPLALVALEVDDLVDLRVVSRLRVTDRAWRRGRTLMVLLTETDRAQAGGFASRLGDLVTPGGVRIAAFPEDAVTADGLFGRLSEPDAGAPTSSDAEPMAAARGSD